MLTTPEHIDLWRKSPSENQRLEFKEAKEQFDNRRLYEYCVALANEGGGILLLGVADIPPRAVVGTKAFNNPQAMAEKLFQVVGFRVDIEEVAHPDGRVLVFHIPSRPRGTAYHLDGKYLMRVEGSLVPMTEDQLRKIFNEGKAGWLSQIAKSSITSDDVVQLLDTQCYFDLMHLPYPSSREGVLDKFEKERLVIREVGAFSVTYLGALLFAKKLDDFDGFKRKAPRMIVYEGTGKLKTRLDKTGEKGYVVGFEGLIDFVNNQIPTNEIIGKALRQEVKMFPEKAIRELVANALIHQDLSESGSHVMVELYSDRMEVSNPGTPFIPVDRFIDEYRSRNDQLADLMRRMGICEEKGSGIDRVIESAEVFQLPAPDFRVGEHRTVAILYGHKEFKDMDRNDRARACYQHCCLRYVMNQKMTNQSLRERFKLPEDRAEAVSRIIRDTIGEKKIKTEDPDSTSKRYAKYVPFWA